MAANIRAPDRDTLAYCTISSMGRDSKNSTISSDNIDIEHWNEMVDTNCKGLMYVTRAVLKKMSVKSPDFYRR